MRKRLFGIIFLLLIALFSVMLIGAVDYFISSRYVGELKKVGKPEEDTLGNVPNVSEQTLSRVGFILTDKKTSFVNFPKEKKPGTIRIGIFGDSFSYGDEVDSVSDYGGFLQALLRDYDFPKVEVINFGTSWHGFGQAHIIWDEVGHQYNLDYALFGPATFFPDRDTRFNHSKGLAPYYLHARYILADDAVKLVDVIGDTYPQRFDAYYSFVPLPEYMRNDRNAPVFLSSLMPPGREIENPFYYSSATEAEEAKAIYRRLVRRMDEDSMQKIVALYPWITDFEAKMPDRLSEGRCIARIDRPTNFPYLEPNDHNSPTGNALLARQYLAALLGNSIETRIIETEDRNSQSPDESIVGPLSSFTHYSIRLNGVDAGVFASVAPGVSAIKPSKFFAESNVSSLIGFKKDKGSALDGVFLALPRSISPDTSLTLRFESKGSLLSEFCELPVVCRIFGINPARPSASILPLGALRPISKSLGISEVELPGLEVLDATFGADRIQLDASKLSGLPPTDTFQIIADDEVLLEGSRDPKTSSYFLRPVGGELITVRSTPSGDAAAYRGADTGNVELILERAGATQSVKLADWHMERTNLQPPAECAIKSLKTLAGETISIVASGDSFDGPPRMRVLLDNDLLGEVPVAADHSVSSWQSFRFPVRSLATAQKLRIELANDKVGTTPTDDRNLYIKSITINGRTLKLEDGESRGFPGSEGIAGQPRPIYNGSLIVTLTEKSIN